MFYVNHLLPLCDYKIIDESILSLMISLRICACRKKASASGLVSSSFGDGQSKLISLGLYMTITLGEQRLPWWPPEYWDP